MYTLHPNTLHMHSPDGGHDRVGHLAGGDEADVRDVDVPDDLLQDLSDVDVDEAAATAGQVLRVGDLARTGSP